MTLMLFCALHSCKPDTVGFSNMPEIRLESVELIKASDGKDSIIEIAIYYQDGDGDIGLSDTDTASPFDFGSPFYHNLPVTYLVPNGIGEYEELINPNNNKPYGNQHERVPVLTPTSKYKAISGIMRINLTANPALAKPQKIKLELKMIDRSLNISNTVTTLPIELEH